PALVPEELFPRAIFSGVMGFSSGMYVASESRPSGSLGLDGVAPTAPSSVMQTRSSAERHDFMPAPPSSFAMPHRNRERARRAHTLLALHPNRPPVQLEEFPRQSQPKPVALHLLRRRPRLSKFLSNTWLQLSRFDSNESHSALFDHLGGAAADAPGWHPCAVAAVAASDHDPEVIRRGDDWHLRLRIRLVDPVGPRACSVVDAPNQFSHGQPHLGVQELAQLPPPKPGAPNLLSVFRAECDDHRDAIAHLMEDRRAEIAHGGN